MRAPAGANVVLLNLTTTLGAAFGFVAADRCSVINGGVHDKGSVQIVPGSAVVLAGDQVEVVDTGRGRRRVDGFGAGLGVRMPGHGVRGGFPEGLPVVVHRDVGHVERVEHQLDPPPGQRRVDLVGVGQQGHRRCFRDAAELGPPERLGHIIGAGYLRAATGAFPAGGPPGEGRLFSFGVDPRMVNSFDPSGEQPIQIQ